MQTAQNVSAIKRYWREVTLILVPLFVLAGVMSLSPIAQDLRYHHFADTRALLGVANFANVVSNVPFLIFGIAGLFLGARRSGASASWTTLFAAVALVCFGSGWYHAFPANATLVWDRLPMTVAFTALLVALLAEHVNPSLDRYMLLPAVAVGLASIGWWCYADDLRFYFWVQLAPMLAIALALLLFRATYTHRIYLLYALALYVLAKVAEYYDPEIYAVTGRALSGHSLKHLLAAASVLCIYVMLRLRQPSNH